MGLQLKITSTVLDYWLLSIALLSDVTVALTMLRTFNDSATYKGIIATIPVSAK
jgi:hypothetical protein